MSDSVASRTILHLLDTRGFGGIESHVAALARSQVHAGRQVILLRLTDHGPHPLASLGLPLRVAGGVRGLLRCLTGSVLLHTHGYKAGVLGRACARLTNTPVVSTYHAGDRGTGRVALWTRLDEWTAPPACLAVSSEIAARLPHRALVLPPPVPLEEPQPLGPLVAFAGRLSPEKAPECFLQAVSATGVAAALLGDGPLAGHLTIPPGVEAPGAVAMAEWWPRIGLLCLPSLAEGVPMVVLEAMARAIPVVASAVGELPQLLADGAAWALIPPGDSAALAAAIQRWQQASEEERRRAGARGRCRLARYAGPESVLARLDQVYQRAADQCSR
ncbi:MAG: glycosyltransferase family 4 protein [Alphaproteobacteria bacterium]|nr:glycosyltransferase family 4 protein [Alphaproteobacteria bacterium]